MSLHGLFSPTSQAGNGSASHDVPTDYRSVVEALSEGIVVVQRDSTITMVNASAARLLGIHTDDILGKRLLDLHWHAIRESGEVYPHAEHPALVTLRTGVSLPKVVMGVYQLDRSLRWLSVSTQPLGQYEHGVPIATAVSFTDITEQVAADHALRESEARFRRLSDAANDAIAISANGMLIDVNRALCTLFGYSAHELIGRSLVTLIAPEMWAETTLRIQQHLEGRSTNLGMHKDGTRIPLQVSTRLSEDNGRWERISVIRDLRERDALEKMKGEFIATVSHELRTPLTAIHGALGLLESNVFATLPSKGHHLLRIARSNTDRLMRLINNILDLERLDAGDIHLSFVPIDLKELSQRLARELKASANLKHITIVQEVTNLASFVSDWNHLFQVLENLLSNAIKFSPKGSNVTLRITPASPNHVLFEIIDPGIGIPSEMIERIFHRFIQLDSSDTRETGGVGLGLAISRSIIDRLGGRIDVESEPNVKTRFWFTLPLTLIASDNTSSSTEAKSSATGDRPTE
jgi:PAS domain S-box-containing protein